MRKLAIFIMFLSVIAGTVIVVYDYYRSTPVSIDEELETETIELTHQTLPNAQHERKASFCITGDNLIHESVYHWGERLASNDSEQKYDFKPIYNDLHKLLAEADFSIVNQSSLVSAKIDENFAAGYPLFCSPAALGKNLVELGVDGINVANNHMLDFGEEGLYRSLSYWNRIGATVFGGYTDENALNNYGNRVIEINGIRVAVLSYTEHTNGIHVSNDTSIPYFVYKQGSILKQSLEKDVTACKKISDFVIVLMNWGNSAGFDPSDTQKDAAQILCDAGADMIVGTGAKVIQPIVELRSQNGTHETLCAYSLGNIMGTMEYMDNLLGGILSFTIQMEQGDAVLSSVKFHPTVIYYDANIDNIRVVRLENYTKAMNYDHGSNLKLGMTEMSWFSETLFKYITKEYL